MGKVASVMLTNVTSKVHPKSYPVNSSEYESKTGPKRHFTLTSRHIKINIGRQWNSPYTSVLLFNLAQTERSATQDLSKRTYARHVAGGGKGGTVAKDAFLLLLERWWKCMSPWNWVLWYSDSDNELMNGFSLVLDSNGVMKQRECKRVFWITAVRVFISKSVSVQAVPRADTHTQRYTT